MRVLAILLSSLFFLSGIAVAQSGSSSPPELVSFNMSSQEVDITDPADPGIRFTVNARDDYYVYRADVRLIREGSDDLFTLPMQRTSPAPPPGPSNVVETWEKTLERTEVRLTVGTWKVYFVLYDADGGVTTSSQGEDDEPPTFDVTASEPEPPLPVITLFGEEEGIVIPQVLGPGDFLRFATKSNIPSRTTYQLEYDLATQESCGIHQPVGPELPLPAPHILYPHSFCEGRQTLVAKHYDRAHNVATIRVPVTVDTAPPVTKVLVPNATYAGVGFNVTVHTFDALGHELSFRLGGDLVQVVSVAAGKQITTFAILHNETGTLDLLVQARDDVWNMAQVARALQIKPAFTQLAITGSQALDPWLLPGERARFEVDVTQLAGVVHMPVEVLYSAPGASGNATGLVPVGQTRTVSFGDVFLPGRHDLRVQLSVHDAIEVRNATDLEAWVSFEVFLGKTQYGESEYFIRTDNRGVLPQFAVNKDTNQTHELSLVNRQAGAVYEFTVGEETLFWDPLHMVTTIPVPEPEVETPAMGLLGILALLGVAAFLARRRVP